MNSTIPDKILDQMADKIGARIHDMWREKRIKESGWHAPEDCQSGGVMKVMGKPGRCPNCRNLMRSWDKLDEKDKIIFRACPKAVLEVLEGTEYEVLEVISSDRIALLEELEVFQHVDNLNLFEDFPVMFHLSSKIVDLKRFCGTCGSQIFTELEMERMPAPKQKAGTGKYTECPECGAPR